MQDRRRKKEKAWKRLQEERRDRIKEHKQLGKTLLAPWNQHPSLNMQAQSWRDQRFPQMLWAALIRSRLGQDTAIALFRSIVSWARDRVGSNLATFTHTEIANLSPILRADTIDHIVHTVNDRAVLRPLLLLPGLPGYADWASILGEVPDLTDWTVLEMVVLQYFNHQSQESTDLRWLRVFGAMSVGKLQFPSRAMIDKLVRYPAKYDQREVRPLVRSTEGAVDGLLPDAVTAKAWSTEFWRYVYKNTPPVLGTFGNAEECVVAQIDKTDSESLLSALDVHYFKTRTESLDPKHDVCFGLAIATVRVLSELLKQELNQSILSWFGLRFMVESSINLAYLISKNTEDLWVAYRMYGYGQAKLISMKFERDGLAADSLDLDYINAFVEEEKSEAFINVELGDWTNANLRERAQQAGVKPLYDTFYDYLSNTTHATWAGIAPIAFAHNMNPLHRLQRIPRRESVRLKSMVSDGWRITDAVLRELAKVYPGLTWSRTANPGSVAH